MSELIRTLARSLRILGLPRRLLASSMIWMNGIPRCGSVACAGEVKSGCCYVVKYQVFLYIPYRV